MTLWVHVSIVILFIQDWVYDCLVLGPLGWSIPRRDFSGDPWRSIQGLGFRAYEMEEANRPGLGLCGGPHNYRYCGSRFLVQVSYKSTSRRLHREIGIEISRRHIVSSYAGLKLMTPAMRLKSP